MDEQKFVVSGKLVDFLKTYDTFDKYVLFLLSLGFSVAETAKLVGFSRATVYRIIERNADLMDGYYNTLAEPAREE